MPVFIVAGENAFQTIVSQIFVAIKREIPEPSPYPFYSFFLINESNKRRKINLK